MLVLLGRPIQRTFFPKVDVTGFENQQEQRGTRQSLPADFLEQIAEYRPPAEHEHDLDIEDDEQHRDEVELDAESRLASLYRRQAALVGAVFDWVVGALLADEG